MLRQEETRESWSEGRCAGDRCVPTPIRSGVCTASRLPRSWSVWACRTCGPMRLADCSCPDAPTAGPAATAPTTSTGYARIGDLLDVGLNLAGISMVLDLETQNSELRAEKSTAARRLSDRNQGTEARHRSHCGVPHAGRLVKQLRPCRATFLQSQFSWREYRPASSRFTWFCLV